MCKHWMLFIAATMYILYYIILFIMRRKKKTEWLSMHNNLFISMLFFIFFAIDRLKVFFFSYSNRLWKCNIAQKTIQTLSIRCKKRNSKRETHSNRFSSNEFLQKKSSKQILTRYVRLFIKNRLLFNSSEFSHSSHKLFLPKSTKTKS